MLLANITPVFADETIVFAATPAATTVLVDGRSVVFDAYDINGTIHFKLRDLAHTLSGTAKQFEIVWDGVNNAIQLIGDRPYTAVGGEMANSGAGYKAVSPTKSKTYLDGREVQLIAYYIDGNNYFKLRDIGRAFDFKVVWDGTGNTFMIDTGQEYTAAEMPDDFNFTIDFGTYGKNNIDTYHNTFTKDLVIAGTETIDFVIPAEKMREIYEVFEEYKISGLPDDINAEVKHDTGQNYTAWTPSARYSLTYTCDGKTRTIVCEDGGPWYADSGPPDSRNRLVAFVSFVSEYIYSTKDYQKMSPGEGGYL